MGFEELLENPEGYHKESFRASNKVFLVEFDGEKYVVKKPRMVSSLIEAYYVFQDKFFHASNRRLSTAKQRFEREIEKLDALGGFYAPRLIAYDSKTIVREYLNGTDFRNLKTKEEKVETLEEAVNAIFSFHQLGLVLGNAHVKNLIKCNDKVYWCDFEGRFDESDKHKAQALDLLKFIYSTYTVTRDFTMTEFAAMLVSNKLSKWDAQTIEKLTDLATKNLSSLRLWFPTRLPLNRGYGSHINLEIGGILIRRSDQWMVDALKQEILRR